MESASNRSTKFVSQLHSFSATSQATVCASRSSGPLHSCYTTDNINAEQRVLTGKLESEKVYQEQQLTDSSVWNLSHQSAAEDRMQEMTSTNKFSADTSISHASQCWGQPENGVSSTLGSESYQLRSQQIHSPESGGQQVSSTCSNFQNCVGSRTGTGSETLCHSERQVEQHADEVPHSTGVHHVIPRGDSGFCQVCNDVAAGFYCGAFVCEACKKFFIRASKQERQKFLCLRQGHCKITKESRVQCQYCRYQKCLQLCMYYPGEGKRSVNSLRVSGIPCRVCGAPSSGFHFGALTCEGCKGFFRRMVKEREPGLYRCSSSRTCQISAHTRNMCKACRYQKCISIGMSVEGSRIGRQPNAVKHAISLEVKKQHSVTVGLTRTVDSSSLPSNKDITASSLDGAGEKSDITSSAGSEKSDFTSSAGSGKADITSSGIATEFTTVKEEASPVICLTDVELLEMPSKLVVKEEPKDEESEDQLMITSLQLAGRELAHMCMVDRAKSEIFDETMFQSYPIMWKKQMKHFEFHTQCVLRFTKKVPGFRKLPLDDQVILVQNALYPIVVMNHARCFELETGFFNYFNFSKLEERALLAMCPEFTVLQDHFRHTGLMAQVLEMTDMEYIFLSCLLLFDTECSGLEAERQIQQFHDKILQLFEAYENKNYMNGSIRFGQMLLRISELVLARVQHLQVISKFLARQPYLEVPQLYREMFL